MVVVGTLWFVGVGGASWCWLVLVIPGCKSPLFILMYLEVVNSLVLQDIVVCARNKTIYLATALFWKCFYYDN